MGYIRNAVLIEAPVEEVFRLTNNVRAWPELFTEYESCEVLEEASDAVTCQLTMYPDENGNRSTWVSRIQADKDRRSTASERLTSSGPFEHMTTRWWYDSVNRGSTIMTWEQEFVLKPTTSLSEDQAIDSLNRRMRIQQKIIKERIEHICQSSLRTAPLYCGFVVGRYQPGNEEKIAAAFRQSDATELPHILGVKTRRIWVQGDLYLHFVEGQVPIPTVQREYKGHPLLKTVKQEVDQYVTLLDPETPAIAREIYNWQNQEHY